jgi:cation:H+ antiporter
MVYFLLFLGFGLLIYGGDTLVSGSVKVAKRLGVSPLLIGLTLVGFGTSTPELVTSLLAAFNESADIAVGNVVGSNTANILLVLGAAAVISPVKVDIGSFKRDGLFLLLSTIAIIIASFIGKIGFIFGLILVSALTGYVVYSYISDRKNQKALKEKEQEVKEETTAKDNLWLSLGQTFLGIALTILGARFLVNSAIELAQAWGVSQAVIGLTIVAIGTSLPELITSVMSSLKGHNDVAFGNVVGSNIYNALFILGITALFIPINLSADMNKNIWIMTAVTLALIGIALLFKKFSRLIGFLFLVAYAIYTWVLFA